MYPQPGMYPQQYPVAGFPPALVGQGAATTPELPVQLPDPESTGPAEPAPRKQNSENSEQKQDGAKQANPSELAADIIKSYTQRRPNP
jgi:hypothetical protein